MTSKTAKIESAAPVKPVTLVAAAAAATSEDELEEAMPTLKIDDEIPPADDTDEEIETAPPVTVSRKSGKIITPPPPPSPEPVMKAKQIRTKTVSYYIAVSRKKPDSDTDQEIENLNEAVSNIFGEHNENKLDFIQAEEDNKLFGVDLFYRADAGELSERAHLHIVYNIKHKTEVKLEEDELLEMVRENLGNVHFCCFQYGGKLSIADAIKKRGAMVLKEETKLEKPVKMALVRPSPLPEPKPVKHTFQTSPPARPPAYSPTRPSSSKKIESPPAKQSRGPDSVYRHKERISSLRCFGIPDIDECEYSD